VHHILPAQGSGFANIISEPLVKEVAKKHGIEWEPTSNFLTQRLPPLIDYYLLTMGRLPHGNEPGIVGWIKELFTVEAIQSSVNTIT